MTRVANWLFFTLTFSVVGSTATIRGIVIDEGQAPIRNAKVKLMDVHKVGEGIIQYVYSGSDGRFVIDHVPAGSYLVYAQKAENGYGDPAFTFFSSGAPPSPEVNVLKDDQNFDVVVNLGTPGGHLNVSLVDADSGSPIGRARYRLSLAKNPSIYISSSATEDGEISTPVPAQPLNLTISAPGYKSASLSDLQLKSGGRKQLTVKMNKNGNRPPAK